MNKKRKKIYDKTRGKCYYCGCDLPERWHKDHLHPLMRNPVGHRDKNGKLIKVTYSDENCEHPERDNFENLVPSCPRCNIRKSTLTVEQFRNTIKDQINQLNKHSNQYELAKDYGLIKETKKEVIFYFEKQKLQ
ncbi:MAG TPA: hypothetical protein VLA13_00250 [Massilibacterium sp.]|nr:hypothetical protein [Massilibacterium sp.]